VIGKVCHSGAPNGRVARIAALSGTAPRVRLTQSRAGGRAARKRGSGSGRR
jgi:hypothetical protein